jgi:hypothetical protein
MALATDFIEACVEKAIFAVEAKMAAGTVILPDATLEGVASEAVRVAIEAAASTAEQLTVTTQWLEGHAYAVRHPSPVETAAAIRKLASAA